MFLHIGDRTKPKLRILRDVTLGLKESKESNESKGSKDVAWNTQYSLKCNQVGKTLPII